MWLVLIGFVALLGVLASRLNKDFSWLAVFKTIKRVNGGDINDLYPVIPGKTVFGNIFDVAPMTQETFHQYICDCVKYSKGKSFFLMFLRGPVFNIVRPEDAEVVLTSKDFREKGHIYKVLTPFIGTGLLTSGGKKWHLRRKLLTPAFHFNVLQSFVEIFKEESLKLMKVFDENLSKELSLSSVIPRLALNTVCESAMGIKLHNMEDGDEYRRNVKKLEVQFVKRFCNPLFHFDFIYKIFGDYKEYSRLLNNVQAFTAGVINSKREEFKNKPALNGAKNFSDIDKKKRFAMLDTLLDAETKGLIDHGGICEEVDTFMFEGYDTTATCLIFTLMCLALNEDVQDKCFSEVSLLGDLSSQSVFDYNKLEYLDCVIKESLRLYPTVPSLARKCVDEVTFNGIVLPKATQVNLFLFHLHHDPRNFPDPLKFDPNRFLPENSKTRHPFAFIPFSFGQRNCIGQKFAMLEMKVFISSIVRNYKLLPVTQPEELIFGHGIVLRTQQQIKIKAVKRT